MKNEIKEKCIDCEYSRQCVTMKQINSECCLKDRENERLKEENNRLYDLCESNKISYLEGIEDVKQLNGYKYDGFVEKWLKEMKEKLQRGD